jgi:hypothetical protein
MNELSLQRHQLVRIPSGDIEVRNLVREHSSLFPGSSSLRAWRNGDLKKNGQPDRRVRGHGVGVRIDRNSGRLYGDWAFYSPALEEQASSVRREIAALEEKLSAARQSLLSIYSNQPAPL